MSGRPPRPRRRLVRRAAAAPLVLALGLAAPAAAADLDPAPAPATPGASPEPSGSPAGADEAGVPSVPGLPELPGLPGVPVLPEPPIPTIVELLAPVEGGVYPWGVLVRPQARCEDAGAVALALTCAGLVDGLGAVDTSRVGAATFTLAGDGVFSVLEKLGVGYLVAEGFAAYDDRPVASPRGVRARDRVVEARLRLLGRDGRLLGDRAGRRLARSGDLLVGLTADRDARTWANTRARGTCRWSAATDVFVCRAPVSRFLAATADVRPEKRRLPGVVTPFRRLDTPAGPVVVPVPTHPGGDRPDRRVRVQRP